MLYHDSHDSYYRYPLGAMKCGKKVRIRFRCDESTSVTLRTWDGHEENHEMFRIEWDIFEYTIQVPNVPMLFWYDFIIHREYDTARYGAPADQLGGVGCYYSVQPHSFQITVYSPDYHTPDFMHTGVMYQIFPDRYNNDNDLHSRTVTSPIHADAIFHSDWNEKPAYDPDPVNGDNRAVDFFGGTLNGIREKLKYLKDMGISVIYLNPVFESHTNHRYDTGSYEQIDPILGTKDDLIKLFQEAKELEIHILMDGVFSHTGADSTYFNLYGHFPGKGACQGPESAYYSWYSFDSFPDKYKAWWGFYTLPAVNKENPSYRYYLTNSENGILPYWINIGASGWRLDVADELPISLIRQMRASIKAANPMAALLGEVWEDASAKTAYGQLRSYCLGDTLDSVMNYPLRRAVIDFFTGICDAYHLCRVIRHQQEVYPAPFLYSLMNLLGSHDRVRILNAMAGYDQDGIIQMDRKEAGSIRLSEEQKDLAKNRFINAFRLICSLPGIPCIYYGDEIGMEGMADPWNRAPMQWKNGDYILQGKIKELVHERNSCPALNTGYMSVEAADTNTIKVYRWIENGKDIFDVPTENCSYEIVIHR